MAYLWLARLEFGRDDGLEREAIVESDEGT